MGRTIKSADARFFARQAKEQTRENDRRTLICHSRAWLPRERSLIVVIVAITIGLSSIARAGVGAAALALSQGEQCKKNLQGETQYASMLHDERDQYEQQDAALVIQRDELKKQIQELGKQLADLQKQLGSSEAVKNGPHQQMSRTELIPSSPAATPSPAPSPAKSRTQPGWPNPSK